MSTSAVIYGLAGLAPTPREAAFFREAEPWGFILFARNLDTPEQIRALTGSLRDIVGRDAPVLIDQEGGRVQRLGPPRWPAWDAPLGFAAGRADRAEMFRLRYRLIAHDLHALGIDVNCAPMADIARPDTHEILRNRCYSTRAREVAPLGRAVAEGLLAGGVLPVLKHIPGHGSTPLDSHQALPVVDAPRETLDAEDFAPFKELADLRMAMSAHVVYTAIDPEHCATMSRDAIGVIRDDIGFAGLLMTDDLSMHALHGSMAARARDALTAGCDMILHCDGDIDAMETVAGVAPTLDGPAAARAGHALAERRAPEPFDPREARARLAAELA